MGNPRRHPKLLGAKLLTIREFLNVSQADMATKLQLEVLSYSRWEYQIDPARVSDYEKGKREPNLFVIIAYGRLGNVHLESMADDYVTVETFRLRLGREGYGR
jgi:transcriptional regulator with XRE-family HTH domain